MILRVLSGTIFMTRIVCWHYATVLCMSHFSWVINEVRAAIVTLLQKKNYSYEKRSKSRPTKLRGASTVPSLAHGASIRSGYLSTAVLSNCLLLLLLFPFSVFNGCMLAGEIPSFLFECDFVIFNICSWLLSRTYTRQYYIAHIT